MEKIGRAREVVLGKFRIFARARRVGDPRVVLGKICARARRVVLGNFGFMLVLGGRARANLRVAQLCHDGYF